ncbi:MAG: hypothetical protein RI922_2896 [Bacteroidota bacterium]|jgi:hypothetical protein
MTEAEARIFLGYEPEDELEDVIEDKLFEFKQFFLSKPIIWSTFIARLEKLAKIKEAIACFDEVENKPSINLPVFQATENILEAFQSFQQVRNTCFLAINRATTCQEIEIIINSLLNSHTTYASLWPEIEFVSSTVILSKEPDSMDLLSGIKSVNLSGIATFADLAEKLTDQSTCVAEESKRLFMLHQKVKEWMKS